MSRFTAQSTQRVLFYGLCAAVAGSLSQYGGVQAFNLAGSVPLPGSSVAVCNECLNSTGYNASAFYESTVGLQRPTLESSGILTTVSDTVGNCFRAYRNLSAVREIEQGLEEILQSSTNVSEVLTWLSNSTNETVANLRTLYPAYTECYCNVYNVTQPKSESVAAASTCVGPAAIGPCHGSTGNKIADEAVFYSLAVGFECNSSSEAFTEAPTTEAPTTVANETTAAPTSEGAATSEAPTTAAGETTAAPTTAAGETTAAPTTASGETTAAPSSARRLRVIDHVVHNYEEYEQRIREMNGKLRNLMLQQV